MFDPACRVLCRAGDDSITCWNEPPKVGVSCPVQAVEILEGGKRWEGGKKGKFISPF